MVCKMKYVLFYETENMGEAEKRMQRFQEAISKMEKEGTSTGKLLTPPYVYPDLSGGFQLIEAEHINDIVALVTFYYGAAKFTVKQLVEIDEVLKIREKVSKF